VPVIISSNTRTASSSGKTGAFLCASPSQTFHVVKLRTDNTVSDICYVRDANLLVNCGFFAF
jgi:hypothetical protein